MGHTGQGRKPGESHTGEQPSIVHGVLVFGSGPDGLQGTQAMVVLSLGVLLIQDSELRVHGGVQGQALCSGCRFQGILAFQRSSSLEPGLVALSVLPRRAGSLPHTPVPGTGDDVLFPNVDVLHLF